MQLGRSDRVLLGSRGGGSLLLAIAAVALISRTSLVERVELYSYDARAAALSSARARGWSGVRPSPATSELVLVKVDDASVSTFSERLPIARWRVAEAVRLLGQAGASVTVLDYYLHGASQNPADDTALEAAIRGNGRVLLALRPTRERGEMRAMASDPRFAAALLGQASPRVREDPDSLHRSAQVFAMERELPEGASPLSLPMLAVYHHLKLTPRDVVRGAPGEPLELKVGRTAVPVNSGGAMLLDMPSPSKASLMFTEVSFHELARRLGREPDLVRGKIVLVGETHVGHNDYKRVPLGPVAAVGLPGVFLHGVAIANLLGQGPRERASAQLDLLLLIVLGALGASLFVVLPERRGGVALVVLLAVHALVCFAVFMTGGLWIASVAPAFLLVVLFAQTVWMRLAEERQARARCEVLLSSYFSPAAAAGLEVADDPRMAEKLLAAKELLAPDGYEITGRLGQGGMSVVFRAVHKPLGRTVALKFISPRLYQDEAARGRFLREARVAAAVLHPNLVAVFDSGESRGVPFIAMEVVEGESLKSLIDRRRRLPPADAAGLLKEVLRGLAVIHDHKIVHRDIKSENVMISKDQQVKIADFGIAKAEDAGGFQTLQDIIMGTPAYMAPEIIRGEKPTPAADIYATGIMLFEMLTGTVPFLGESASKILMMHVNDPMPDASSHGVELPRGLAALLRRMVEKLPADRYASCVDILAEVEKIFPDAQTPTAVVTQSVSGKFATVTTAPTPSSAGTIRTSRKTAAADTSQSRITRS